RVLEADFLDKGAHLQDRRIEFRARCEFLVVDRKNERRRARLLLRELRQVTVAGDAEDFQSFLLDRRRERANPEPGRVLGKKVLVDDDDWKTKFHAAAPAK